MSGRAGEEQAAALAGRRGGEEVRALWRRLTPGLASIDTFDPATLDDLPEAAQRWLRHAIAPGTALGRAGVFQMHGRIRLGRWLPFRAIQLQVPGVGYLWVARARMGPITISGYDSYLDGVGQMRWRLFGALPVVNASGPDVDRSAAGRVALDAFLVPTAWVPGVSPGLTWESGSPSDTAKAQWRVGDQLLRAELNVAEGGALRSLSMARWANPHGEPWAQYPCGGELGGEAAFGGLMIPANLRAGYFFGTDRWAQGEFFRATITEAEFF